MPVRFYGGPRRSRLRRRWLFPSPRGHIADESRPRFRAYVSGQRHPSYRYDREVRVGADLSSSGVTYY